MIPLSSPPPGLIVADGERITGTGAWRSWSSSSEACAVFRSAFRSWAQSNQGSRCAYCVLSINSTSHRRAEIDHFVPKAGNYGEWTYESRNLVLACAECNSGLKKSYFPLITPAPCDYAECSFTMVHPYLDTDRSLHFEGGYLGGTITPEPIKALTDAARETVRIFGLFAEGMLNSWRAEYLMARFAETGELTGQLDLMEQMLNELS